MSPFVLLQSEKTTRLVLKNQAFRQFGFIRIGA
jgi:hypothetical protein